jgi:S1-C subfamily serine protease
MVPADKSNLKANDVIAKIGNTKISYASDIRNAISSVPNQNVLIDVYRDGDLLQFPVRVGSSEDIDGNLDWYYWSVLWNKSILLSVFV